MASKDAQSEENPKTQGSVVSTRHSFITFKSFMVFYCITMMVLTAATTYINGILVQIEKQFGLSSGAVGIFSSSNFLSTTFCTLILGYLAKDWNKPRIIAMGGFFYAFTLIMMTFPHYIYGTRDFYARETKNGSDVIVCYPDRPEEDCTEKEISSSGGPFGLLVLTGLLRGVAHAPFYPLGLSYTYMNADNAKQAALCIGKYVICFFLFVCLFVLVL